MIRVLFLLLCLACPGCREGAGRATGSATPVEVGVVAAATREVPNRFDFIGSVEATKRAELRARVRGYVTAIGFEEGAVVDEGQVLFELDTRPLQAEQRAAAAALQRVRAQLGEARRRLSRERRLQRSGASSAEQLETAQAEVDALEAELEAQRASLQQARLDVGYSKIRAPFAGRIGERLADIGELVGDANPTPLAVLIQEDPVFVRFAPTERQRRELLALDPQFESKAREGRVPVRVVLANGTVLEQPGRLTFVDNAMDPATRSLVYKATVASAGQGLTAGESVTIVLELPPTERVVVPVVAVASMQDVDYVYVVGADGVAHHREVELGRSVGQERVILAGLEAGERVVVRGIQRVRDGAKVTVADAPVEAG